MSSATTGDHFRHISNLQYSPASFNSFNNPRPQTRDREMADVLEQLQQHQEHQEHENGGGLGALGGAVGGAGEAVGGAVGGPAGGPAGAADGLGAPLPVASPKPGEGGDIAGGLKVDIAKAKEEGKDEYEAICEHLANIVEKSIQRVDPFLKMINHHVDILDRKRANEEPINEKEFVDTLRPLIEQASAILQETYGAIKAVDPKGQAVHEAQLKAEENKASPEQGRLAKALATLTGDVTKTIENAKDKIKDMPKVERDLGPMLDLLSQPLIQILGAVGLLLHGVLTLVGNLLSGIGLSGVVEALLSSLGLKDILNKLGFTYLIGGKKGAKK